MIVQINQINLLLVNVNYSAQRYQHYENMSHKGRNMKLRLHDAALRCGIAFQVMP